MDSELVTLEEVRERLNILERLAMDTKVCVENMNLVIHFSKQPHGGSLRVIDGYLDHYFGMCYSHCVIQLAKILNEKEKSSIIKLLNKLCGNKYAVDLKLHFKLNTEKEGQIQSRDQMKQLKIEIDMELAKYSSMIEKLIARRDKVYAHTDLNVKLDPETFQDLIRLLDLVKFLYDSINLRIFGGQFLFITDHWSIANVLNDRKFYDDHFRKIQNGLE